MTLDTDTMTVQATDQACGLRLFTTGKITPRWIAGSVVPAVRALQDEGTFILYLRRGWMNGPHIDLIARGASGQRLSWSDIASRLDAGTVQPGDALTDEAYLVQAREFGRLERVPPPYLPMRPHATVEALSADDVMVWQAPLEGMREIALSQICRPLVNLIDELALDPRSAMVRVAEAFIALANAHYLGAAFGVFSLRSHAEAFLAWAAPRKDPRPAFERRLVDETAQLRPLVEQMISGDSGPEASSWRSAFSYCMGAFDCAVASDALTLEKIEAMGGGFDASTMGPPGVVAQVDPRRSSFHESIDTAGITANPPEWFASYRLLINLFYQQLPLLGVSPMQRYYLCYSVAELVDQVLGQTWHDRLTQLQLRIADAQR